MATDSQTASHGAETKASPITLWRKHVNRCGVRHVDLSDRAARLLNVIGEHCDYRAMRCRATDDDLGAWMGRSPSTAKRARHEAVAAGYLVVEKVGRQQGRSDEGPSVYRLAMPVCSSCQEDVQQVSSAPLDEQEVAQEVKQEVKQEVRSDPSIQSSEIRDQEEEEDGAAAPKGGFADKSKTSLTVDDCFDRCLIHKSDERAAIGAINEVRLARSDREYLTAKETVNSLTGLFGKAIAKGRQDWVDRIAEDIAIVIYRQHRERKRHLIDDATQLVIDSGRETHESWLEPRLSEPDAEAVEQWAESVVAPLWFNDRPLKPRVEDVLAYLDQTAKDKAEADLLHAEPIHATIEEVIHAH